MTKEQVLIIGGAGHAQVIIDIFEKSGQYHILGILDDGMEKNQKVLGYTILGEIEDIPKFAQQYANSKAFIAIGDNWIRSKVKDKIKALVPHIRFANAIHPSAQLSNNITLGTGIAIMAGAIVNCNSTLGDFVILNTKSSLDHDGILGDFSSLAPNATTGGNVTVGAWTAISISATIKHGITIGEHALIGAGALVLHDCDAYQIMYGVPAQVVRTREMGDRYL